MPTPEAKLRRALREYAVQVRRLAYALPNGVGEYDLLELSNQMRAAADHAGQGMTGSRDKEAEPADPNSAASSLPTGTESASRQPSVSPTVDGHMPVRSDPPTSLE